MEEAARRLSALAEEVKSGAGPLYVTSGDRAGVVMLSVEAYESLLETLEIESDGELVGSIRRGAEDVAAGRTRPAGEVIERIRRERGAAA